MITCSAGGQSRPHASSGSFSMRTMGAKIISMWSSSNEVTQASDISVCDGIVRPVSPLPEKIVIKSPVLRPRFSPMPSPPISRQVSPNVSRRPSLQPASRSSPRLSCASAPRSRAVSEDFVLDGAGDLLADQDLNLNGASDCKSVAIKQRAYTDSKIGVAEPPIHLAHFLSQESSTLAVIGNRICVQGADGRRIVVFQADSDNTKQVKMLQQICSAVRSLAPEAWHEQEVDRAPRPQVCQCCICMEEHSWGEGLECAPGGHFICNSCFETYVKTECALGSKGASSDDGSLYCPGRCDRTSSNSRIESIRCSATFDSHALARHIGREAFESYWAYRSRLAEERIAAEMEAALRARAEAEKRLSDVSRARSELADILTLKCPRCDQAFNDFQGCFALQCARDKCKACFCGWCFKDCGNDPDAAHRHVCYECIPGRQRSPKDPLFGTEAMFESVCQERRQKLLKEHLEKLDPDLRNEVLEMAKSELVALGLAWAPAQRAISMAASSQVPLQPTHRVVQSSAAQEPARIAGTPAQRAISIAASSQVTPQSINRMVHSSGGQEPGRITTSSSPHLLNKIPNVQQVLPKQAKPAGIVQQKSASPTSLHPQQLPRKTLPPSENCPSTDTIQSGQASSLSLAVGSVRSLPRPPGGSVAMRQASIVHSARR